MKTRATKNEREAAPISLDPVIPRTERNSNPLIPHVEALLRELDECHHWICDINDTSPILDQVESATWAARAALGAEKERTQ